MVENLLSCTRGLQRWMLNHNGCSALRCYKIQRLAKAVSPTYLATSWRREAATRTAPARAGRCCDAALAVEAALIQNAILSERSCFELGLSSYGEKCKVQTSTGPYQEEQVPLAGIWMKSRFPHGSVPRANLGPDRRREETFRFSACS